MGHPVRSADNPDSCDSNHALIFRDRVTNLTAVLAEIADFYPTRGQTPIADAAWGVR